VGQSGINRLNIFLTVIFIITRLFVDLEIELVEGVFECLNMEAEDYNKFFNFLNDGSFSKGKHNGLSCYYIYLYITKIVNDFTKVTH
jgi:hypothetical protein